MVASCSSSLKFTIVFSPFFREAGDILQKLYRIKLCRIIFKIKSTPGYCYLRVHYARFHLDFHSLPVTRLYGNAYDCSPDAYCSRYAALAYSFGMVFLYLLQSRFHLCGSLCVAPGTVLFPSLLFSYGLLYHALIFLTTAFTEFLLLFFISFPKSSWTRRR